MSVPKNTDVKYRPIKTIEGLPVQGEARLKPLLTGDQMLMLEIHYPAGTKSPLHAHQHESVCYIIKGKITSIVGEETYTLEAGDACRHPKGVPHAVEALEDTIFIEVKSPPQALEQFLGT